MKDPTFVSIVEQIRANPSLLQVYMKDQRVLQALLVLMGISSKVRDASAMGKEEDEEEDFFDESQAPSEPKANGAPKTNTTETQKSAEQSEPAASTSELELCLVLRVHVSVSSLSLSFFLYLSLYAFFFH